MKFGPLSKIDAEALNELLKDHGSEGVISVSQEHLEHSQKQGREFKYPHTFNGSPAFFFIEIQTKDLLIVRGTLERMGFSVYANPPEPLPEQTEFLCPRCKFVAESPGKCPKHQVELLEYSAWVSDRAAKSNRSARIVAIIALILIALAMLYEAWDSGNSILAPFSNRPLWRF